MQNFVALAKIYGLRQPESICNFVQQNDVVLELSSLKSLDTIQKTQGYTVIVFIINIIFINFYRQISPIKENVFVSKAIRSQ